MAGRVFKRGNVWNIRYEAGRDANGRRLRPQESCPGMTKRQAEELLRQRLTEVGNGTYVERNDMTVAELWERFLRTAKQNITGLSWETYERIGRVHIVPKFGRVHLTKLRPVDVQDWYSDLSERLSPKYVCCIHGAMHVALQRAVELGLLPTNPLGRVKPPAVPQREVQAATRDQIAKLKTFLERHPCRLPFLIIIGTGMRRAEVCGLRWEDVDLVGLRLTIRRSAVRTREGLTTKTTKSGRPRSIDIPEQLARELWGYQQVSSSEWVCPAPGGGMRSPGSLSKAWDAVRTESGAPISLHQLRHAHATELIMAGMPVKAVSERLGHARTRMTEDIYTHVLPTIQKEVARQVGTIFFAEEDR